MYLFAHHAGELVGGAQILSRRVPVVGGVGYLPYGPLIDPTVDDRSMVRRGLVQGLRRLCRKHLRMLFVQPPEGAEDVSADLLAQGFRPSSADIAPAGSIRIDLAEDLETIRSRFGKTLRRWSNKWEAHGVTVHLGGERDVPLLAAMVAQTGERHGFRAPPADYLAALYRELSAGDNAALFVGRVHGVPVAADLVTVCGGMIRGRLAGFDRFSEAARLSVPAAIRWEIIKWGKERGHRWMDFGGLSAATLDALIDGGRSDGPALHRPAEADVRRHALPLSAGRGAAGSGTAADGLRPGPALAPGPASDQEAQRALRGSARRDRDDRGAVGAAQPVAAPGVRRESS